MMKTWLKKGIAVLLLMALLLGVLPAKGENYPFTGITTAVLRLRAGASTASSVLTEMPRGAYVTVTGKKNDFYIVSYNGKSGYASAAYIAVSAVDPMPTPVKVSAYTPITASSDEMEIRTLQMALQELGFYTITVDGKYGSGTKKAVSAFQTKNGLKATGAADVETLELMFDGTPRDSKGKAVKINTLPPLNGQTVSSGKRGGAVIMLQDRLKELGYYSGKSDGVCGSSTVSAIKAFQKKMGLSQTGTADATLQSILYSSAALSAKATATPKATSAPVSGGYPYSTCVTASVNLRKGKSTSTTRLATVPNGAEVSVLASEGDYLKITYKSYTGYVLAQYVDVPVEYLPGKVLPDDLQASLTYIPVYEDSTGREARVLQAALKELGFYTGKVDGVFGSASVTALKAFQNKNGLRADGVASSAVLQFLYESKVKNSAGKSVYINTLPPVDNCPMEPGNVGEQVTELQILLSSKGFYTGTFTETYDAATERAVKAFQKAYGLLVDGKAGAKTWAALIAVAATPAPVIYEYTPVPTEEPLTADNVVVMRSGTRGVAVKRLQQALMDLGYYYNSLDGIYDSDDIAAVKEFQRVNGLKADGIAGFETQQMLYSGFAMPKPTATPKATATPKKTATPKATATPKKTATPKPTATPKKTATPKPTATPAVGTYTLLKKGSRGNSVTQLQQRLISLHYLTGTADGIYGTGTESAVKAFQKANGLKADGIAGLDTQQMLYSGFAIPKPTATPKATATPKKTATPKATATPKKTATPKPTATPKKTATPKPTATPAVGTYTLLKKGSRGNSVTQLQQRLISLHYLTGSADGIYGTGTESAVKAFQKANGLTADGIAGSATQKKLYSSSAKAAATAKPTATPKPDPASEVLRLGSTGDNVKKMQKRLVELGYLTSGVDGEFGLKTYSAVYAFQQRNGLAADGVAGSATLTKLYSSSAVHEKAGVTPAPVTPTPKPKTAFTAPKAAEVRFANWYTEIRSRAKAMPDVVIYEPISGIHYNLHMFSFGKHADAEPPTAEDTALMYQAIGNNSWTAKPVWVIFSDGRVYMASTHSHGHEVDHTSGNNLEGHVCIHFPRVMSEAEQTGPYAVSHQQAILLGWERTQSQIGR